MALDTGKLLDSPRVTKLPLTDIVIRTVENMVRVQGFKELKFNNRRHEPMHDATRLAGVEMEENVEIDQPTDSTDDDPSMEYDSADNNNGAEQGSDKDNNDTYPDQSEDDTDRSDETGRWEPDEDDYEREKFNPTNRYVNDEKIIDHGDIGPGADEEEEPSEHSGESADDDVPSEHSIKNSKDELGDIKEDHGASMADDNDSNSDKMNPVLLKR